jgi:hypothetical protein
MKVTVRTVIAVRVIAAVWSVMRIGARTIARIIRPGVIAVVVRVVPSVVVDIGVVVIDDVAATTAATTPVTVP